MALIDASPIQVTHLVVAYLKSNLGDWTTALEPEADALTGLTIPLAVNPDAIFPSIQNTYPRFPNMTVMAASTENEQDEYGNNELWEIQLDVMLTVRSNKRSADLSAQQHMVYQSQGILWALKLCIRHASLRQLISPKIIASLIFQNSEYQAGDFEGDDKALMRVAFGSIMVTGSGEFDPVI